MMKKALLILSALALFVSCDKEGGKVKHSDGPAYTAVYLEEEIPDDTKLDISWMYGDQISVFRYSDWNEQYQLSNSDDGIEASFAKIGDSPAEFSGKPSKLSAAYAIYPWNAKTVCISEGVFKVWYPESQVFTSPRMAEGFSTYVAATASENDTKLEFRNACCYLKIAVYGIATVKSISVTGNDGEKLGGYGKVTVKADAAPEVEMCADGENAVTLSVGGLEIKDDSENPSVFYVTLPPTEFKKGFTINFAETDGHTFAKTIEGPVAIGRGEIFGPEPFEYLGEIAEINGTVIHSGYTIAGLVTDNTGKALPGIHVSDGYDIVVTDGNGVYQIRANELSRYVYYEVPAAYEIPLDANKCPVFYSTKVKAKEFSRNDFVLTPKTKDETNWTLVGISDPQVYTDAQTNRYKNETVVDMKKFLNAEGYKNCYSIILGDITGGAPAYFPKIKSVMSNFGLNDGSVMPCFAIPGNHDHYKSGAKSQYESLEGYIGNFGPVDYSFNIGKAHIVCMDNYIATNWSGNYCSSYTCGITDDQWEWLQKDLALVENKEETVLIYCSHAAFGDQSNHANYVSTKNHKDDMLRAFTAFHDANLLSGHTHYWRNYILTDYVCKSGRPIYEHNEGAACGWLWATGNINVDGSPNCYAVFDIRGNEFYDWIAKSTNLPKEHQIRVYDGNQIYKDNSDNDYCWYDKTKCSKSTGKSYVKTAFENSFVVSIWGDDDANWEVELYINGVKEGNLTRTTGLAADMCANAYFPQTSQGSSLFEQGKFANHFWSIKVPGNDPAAVTNWEVRATQTIPASGVKHVYTCNTLQTDFAGF